jgi:hypothetical protein
MLETISSARLTDRPGSGCRPAGDSICLATIPGVAGVTVADPDWESRDGRYRVRLYDAWIDVPDDALITEPNRVGRTMVWPMLLNGEISVRCFMPGSMT